MSAERKLFGPERKPWEPNADERLAPSSYAAGAVFGLVELAYEELVRIGVEPTASHVASLAKIYAGIVIRVQVDLGEGGGWASQLNTRLRGALRTVVPTVDLQINVVDYTRQVEERVGMIARGAAWLYAQDPNGLAQ